MKPFRFTLDEHPSLRLLPLCMHQVIVEGLIAGLNSVGYIVVLLLLVIYLFAVLGVQTFGSNDPANFGTVSIAVRKTS